MGPMRRIRRAVGFEPSAGHAFAQAAFPEEVVFETSDLPIEEVISLVDQADENVRDDLGRACLNEGAKVLECNSSHSSESANVAGFF